MARKNKPGAGAKPTLNQKLFFSRQDLLIRTLEVVFFPVFACAITSVPEGTYYEWIKRGKERPKSQYGRFVERVREARAKPAARLIQTAFRTAHGGVVELPVYDTNSRIKLDAEGNPVTVRKTMLPDREQALRLLERMYPKEFNVKYMRVDPPPEAEPAELLPIACTDLFREAIENMVQAGELLPEDLLQLAGPAPKQSAEAHVERVEHVEPETEEHASYIPPEVPFVGPQKIAEKVED